MNIFNTIDSVVMTEKSSKANDDYNHLTVLSPPWVTKNNLKNALLRIFADIQIKKIRSMNVCGKNKKFKGVDGKRSDKKKFIISLLGNAKIFDSNVGFGK